MSNLEQVIGVFIFSSLLLSWFLSAEETSLRVIVSQIPFALDRFHFLRQVVWVRTWKPNLFSVVLCWQFAASLSQDSLEQKLSFASVELLLEWQRVFYDCGVKARLIKKFSLCFRKDNWMSAVLLQGFSVPTVAWCFSYTTRHAAVTWPDLVWCILWGSGRVLMWCYLW